MRDSTKLRTLIIAHGHPDLSKGGAEVAAYNMFQEMERQDEDVYFLARTQLEPHGGAAFSTRNAANEILFHTTMDDFFLFSNLKTRHLWGDFSDLLKTLAPDVVHLHHFYFIGIEIFNVIKRTLPNAKIVLTLHEYLSICHNKGLMLKTDGRLCKKASNRDCSNCFPTHSPGDFYLRERYIKQALAAVDQFIAPSHFLKSRYVDWGLQGQDIAVIENGQLDSLATPDITLPDEVANTKLKLAFFGQINPYKGLDVLLKSLPLLSEDVLAQLSIAIYGSGLDGQAKAFVKAIKSMIEEYDDVVQYYGPYEQHDIPALLSNCDAVVVPSTWWENSPMVIQEAFGQSVPVIGANIGGIAEKIEHGKTGLLFQSGSAASLANLVTFLVENPDVLDAYADNIEPPLPIADCVSQHLSLYSELRK